MLTQRVYQPLSRAQARELLQRRRLGPASLRLLPKQTSEAPSTTAARSITCCTLPAVLLVVESFAA